MKKLFLTVLSVVMLLCLTACSSGFLSDGDIMNVTEEQNPTVTINLEYDPEDGGGSLSLYREGHGVELRLGKNVALGIFQKLPVRAFHVVTVDHSDAGEPLDAEHPARLGKECPRFSRERLFLFDEQSVYHISSVQRLHAKRMFIVWICAFNRVLRQELSPRCRDGRTRL